MTQRFSDVARVINSASASPFATVLAIVFVTLWAAAGPASHFSDAWQLAMNTTSSIITFLMVFILNNAQSRDTRAINLKLDELIRSIESADNRAIALEEKPAVESEQLADAIKQAVEEIAEESKHSGSAPTVTG
jgi:low affinity Fe/Cu permease